MKFTGLNQNDLKMLRGMQSRLKEEIDRIEELIQKVSGTLDHRPKPQESRQLALNGGSHLPVNLNTGTVIASYIKAFQKRYGLRARPDLGGKSLGCLKRLIKDYGDQKMAIMVQAYLEMDDSWFKKKCHDIATLEQCIQKVVLAVTTGNKDPSLDRYKGIDEILEEQGETFGEL